MHQVKRSSFFLIFFLKYLGWKQNIPGRNYQRYAGCFNKWKLGDFHGDIRRQGKAPGHLLARNPLLKFLYDPVRFSVEYLRILCSSELKSYLTYTILRTFLAQQVWVTALVPYPSLLWIPSPQNAICLISVT